MKKNRLLELTSDEVISNEQAMDLNIVDDIIAQEVEQEIQVDTEDLKTQLDVFEQFSNGVSKCANVVAAGESLRENVNASNEDYSAFDNLLADTAKELDMSVGDIIGQEVSIENYDDKVTAIEISNEGFKEFIESTKKGLKKLWEKIKATVKKIISKISVSIDRTDAQAEKLLEELKDIDGKATDFEKDDAEAIINKLGGLALLDDKMDLVNVLNKFRNLPMVYSSAEGTITTQAKKLDPEMTEDNAKSVLNNIFSSYKNNKLLAIKNAEQYIDGDINNDADFTFVYRADGSTIKTLEGVVKNSSGSISIKNFSIVEKKLIKLADKKVMDLKTLTKVTEAVKESGRNLSKFSKELDDKIKSLEKAVNNALKEVDEDKLGEPAKNTFKLINRVSEVLGSTIGPDILLGQISANKKILYVAAKHAKQYEDEDKKDEDKKDEDKK